MISLKKKMSNKRGRWKSGAKDCRSAARTETEKSAKSDAIEFRLAGRW